MTFIRKREGEKGEEKNRKKVKTSDETVKKRLISGRILGRREQIEKGEESGRIGSEVEERWSTFGKPDERAGELSEVRNADPLQEAT